jgi:hypothetical protein
LIATAIPEDGAEDVRSGAFVRPSAHDPLDWLDEEVDRLADDLAHKFDQSEKLGVALLAAFESMSDEELSARYRPIEAGLAAWGISGFFVGGGLICEWARYPLLVIGLDLL